jgi:hypothetical protein
MFRRQEEISTEALTAVRSGLAEAQVPEPSAGFNERVHATLARPEAGWLQQTWALIRPALAPAACAMIVTLLLLQGLSATTDATAAGHNSRVVVAYGNPAASQDFLSVISP